MTGKLTVNSSEAADFHGDIALFETDGTKTVDVDADAGLLRLYNGSGIEQLHISGDNSTGGLIYFYNESGATTIYMDGEKSSTTPGGLMRLFNGSSKLTIVLDGDAGGEQIAVADSTGTRTISIEGEEAPGDGAQILMYNTSGVQTLQIDSDSTTAGGYIQLYDSAGHATITLDGETGGDGQDYHAGTGHYGGSDLSEQFDINAPKTPVEAGMLVSIDPQNPGKLIPSDEPYDRKVAGIVSGAGGVKPGMMMGQNGTIANGEYPVALSGRVYALADTSEGGEIKPGDLLTTSRIPGYAMKATDAEKRSGAVIGKAMTSLKTKKGTGAGFGFSAMRPGGNNEGNYSPLR